MQAERGKEALGCREVEEWTLGLGPVPLGWMDGVFRVWGQGHILGWASRHKWTGFSRVSKRAGAVTVSCF